MPISSLPIRNKLTGRNPQRGFAAVSYVLVAVALLAVTGVVVGASINKAAGAQNTFNKASELISQANLIRSKLADCASQGGNNGTGNHPTYPTGTAAAVSGLTCPISGTPNIWVGTGGVFYPPTPADFNAWTYTNDGTSVRFAIVTTNATAWLTALNNAAAKFSASEAAVSGGNTLTITVTL